MRNFWCVILIVVLFTQAQIVNGQCVVINEIMVNPGGNFDGQPPSTSEWLELYNTCGTPADISCMVLADGDFTVTIPYGTVIPGNGFFVIGSSNSQATVDLNITTCNCASGSAIGVYTNNAEQVVLLNTSQEVIDAVVWNGGQFPVSVSSPPLGQCPAITANFPDATGFEVIPTGGNDISAARTCDAGNIWGLTPVTLGTPGASNGAGGAIYPAISSNLTNICPGDCVNFSDLTSGATAWTWTFEGSISSSSNSQNPTSVCYFTPGQYDVQLSVTGACGSKDTIFQNFITVTPNLTPSISSNGPLSVCSGSTVNLFTTAQATTYQWFLNGVVIPGATQAQYDAPSTGLYTVQAVTGNCTSVSNAVSVTVSGSIELQINQSASVLHTCLPELPSLQTTTGYQNYQWYVNGAAVAATGSNFAFTEGAAGSYQVWVQASNGTCSDFSDTVQVTIGNGGAMNLSPFTINICPGQSATLTATPGFTSYVWSEIGASTDVQITISPALSTTVTVYGQDAFGCPSNVSSATVLVTPPLPAVIASSSLYLCANSTATIQSNNVYASYQWFLNGSPLTGMQGSTLNISQAGDYNLQATDSNGCSVISNTLTIDDVSPVIATVSIVQAELPCPGEPVELALNVNGGSLINGTWLVGLTPITADLPDTITVQQSGNYSVAGVDNFGCLTQSNILSLVYPEPQVFSIISSDTLACEGQTVQLSVVPAGFSTTWDNGVVGNSIFVTEPGSYSAAVTDANGCVAVEFFQQFFNPLPAVNAGADVRADCDFGANLTGIGEGAFSWSPASDFDNPNLADVSVNPASTTTYTLTATLNGCSASDEVTVISDCAFVFPPNNFSPNNDANNDLFVVRSRGVSSYLLEIYDRWGAKLFESKDPSRSWNGEFNSQPVAEGTYFYILEAKDRNGNRMKGSGQGTLTLIR